MGDYIFLSNYIKESSSLKTTIEYLKDNRIKFIIQESLNLDGTPQPDLDSVFVNLPKSHETIIDIFDKKELINGMTIYRRLINLYDGEFKTKIENFINLLAYKDSIKYFNYTKSRGILMLIIEVENKMAYIPSNVLLYLTKGFDTLLCKLYTERVLRISNEFGCDNDELTQILANDIWDKYSIDIYTLA